MTKALVVAARPLEILLGLLLLGAAVLKALDAQLFAAQIYNYQVIQDAALLAPIALITLGVEAFLGVALVLGLRLRMLVLGLVQLILIFFTLLIAYAWIVHGIEDCGCFGSVKSPPSVAITKNVIMMLMVAAAWLGFVRKAATRDTPRGLRFKGVASVIAGVAMVAYAYPQFHQQRPAPPPPAPPTAVEGEDAATAPAPGRAGLFSAYTLEDEFGEMQDLGSGEYLVVMLSMTCEHCMETVPALNELFLMPELPPLVAIAYEPQPGTYEQFVAYTDPWFPMHSIGNDFVAFSRLIGSGPPRLSHIRDGHVVQSWDALAPDYAFPSYLEIQEAIEAAGQ